MVPANTIDDARPPAITKDVPEASAGDKTALGMEFDAAYYQAGRGNISYSREEPHWSSFFGGIAARITQSLRPRSVLDAGCGFGFLVEALWDLGTAAYGIDASPYAITQVRRDMVKYCVLGSITAAIPPDSGFPGTFHLVTCFEVLQYMPEPNAIRAVAQLTTLTDTILFSSTPSADEHIHFNVKPISYWLQLFQSHGFSPDLEFDASFVAAHAMLLRRRPPLTDDVTFAFCQLLRARSQRASQADELGRLSLELSRIRTQLEQQELECCRLSERNDSLTIQVEANSNLFNEISSLRTQLLEYHQDLLNRQAAGIRDLARQLDDIKEDQQRLSELSVSRNETAERQRLQDEITIRVHEVQEARALCEARANEVEALHSELEAAKRVIAASEARASEVEALQKELETARRVVSLAYAAQEENLRTLLRVADAVSEARESAVVQAPESDHLETLAARIGKVEQLAFATASEVQSILYSRIWQAFVRGARFLMRFGVR